MNARDFCRDCGGSQKRLIMVKGRLETTACGRCKDTFGWDPEAWTREHGSLPEAAPAPPTVAGGEEKE